MRLAGLVLMIGTIWDAVNDPLIGFVAVNHRFRSGENCRPYALWCSVPLAASLILLFTDFKMSETATVIYSLVIYFLYETFYTFVGIPYNSMGSLATNRDSDRRSINVYRNLGAGLGGVIGAVVCLPLLRLFGGLDEKGNLIDATSAHGFFLTACLMGCVIVAGCFAHYFTTRERVKPIRPEHPHISLKTISVVLIHNRLWLLNALYVICYTLGNLLLMSSLTYYSTYVLGSTAAATAIQAAYVVSAILSSFVVNFADRRLGHHKMMMIGAAIYIIGKVWFLFSPASLAAVYVNAISVGFGGTTAFVLFNTNRNNLVDLIEWQSGYRLDSMVSTMESLVSKLVSAGAAGLITLALSLNGFNADLSI